MSYSVKLLKTLPVRKDYIRKSLSFESTVGGDYLTSEGGCKSVKAGASGESYLP